VLGGPPKLENFLGGGSSTTCPVSEEIRGSSGELGSIAAEFLSCFPTEQQDSGSGLDMVTAAAVPETETRKLPETFGQRTSIYRGVTRYYIFSVVHDCTSAPTELSLVPNFMFILKGGLSIYVILISERATPVHIPYFYCFFTETMYQLYV
jgi:hypothetical protein